MKIDTAKIENYSEMTAEEKLATLEAYEFEAPTPKEPEDVTKLKAALSKANSDAAEWKRQFREKQTEAERAEAERRNPPVEPQMLMRIGSQQIVEERRGDPHEGDQMGPGGKVDGGHHQGGNGQH